MKIINKFKSSNSEHINDNPERKSTKVFAILSETRPLAIGLNLLTGCLLSSFLSVKSLYTYTLLARNENNINAKTHFTNNSRSKLNEKNKGAKINKFFTYCRNRKRLLINLISKQLSLRIMIVMV